MAYISVLSDHIRLYVSDRYVYRDESLIGSLCIIYIWNNIKINDVGYTCDNAE